MSAEDNNTDPFALARAAEPHGDDAILLKLIEEHGRLWQRGTELHESEQQEEAKGYDDGCECLRDQIRVTKPSTIAGAIAQLELAAEHDDPDRVITTIAGLVEIAAREAGPCEPELSDLEKAELRARAEALTAEYDAPLPEGDAGLIEAERRMHELEPRRKALDDDGFQITAEIEEEIINPLFLAMCRLDERSATRPATTLGGAAVKLRRLLHPELGMDTGGKESDLPCLHHVLSVIEREAQS
jgi:hypothetical protein